MRSDLYSHCAGQGRRSEANFGWMSLAVLLMLLSTFAGTKPVNGQSAGAFTQMGFGARGMALGNAQVADISGQASAFYNPALAPYSSGQKLRGSIAALPFDREMQFLQFESPIQPSAGVAAGVVYAGVSDIDGRDDSGYHTGMLSSAEHGLFVAFGARFGERLSGGAAVTFYRARISDTGADAEGIALDLGATYRLSERVHLGIAVKDLLASYNWEVSGQFGGADQLRTDRFPTRFSVGTHIQLAQRWGLLGEGELRHRQLHHPVDGRETDLQGDLRVGISHSPLEQLSIHAGIDRMTRPQQSRPSAGFSLEAPVGQLHLEASYAVLYEQPVQGLAHVLALSIDL